MWSFKPRRNDPLCKFDLRYSGSKPIPSAAHFDSHYSLPFDPRTLIKEGWSKALYPFVSCFPHPEDLLQSESRGRGAVSAGQTQIPTHRI